MRIQNASRDATETWRDQVRIVPVTGLKRGTRAISLADVVESVRLVELDKERTIRRWLTVSYQAKDFIFTNEDGRIIKSLDHGVLVEFPDARCAVDGPCLSGPI